MYALFAIVISLNGSSAFAYPVTLAWDPPTTNADGTPLTDLAGYKVYYGIQPCNGIPPCNYNHKFNIGNATTYTVTNLTEGVTYYFATTAYDTSGNESDYSNEVPFAKYFLTINKSGTGKGTVTSSPTGINCGSDCKEAYNVGKVVTLTAAYDVGSIFTGWSGGNCSGTGTCSITMNATTTMTANFDVQRPVTVTSPNGGEIVASGSTYTILWDATTEVVKFNLMYSVDNGLTWVPIANKVTGTSYPWIVPEPWGNKKACFVRVIGYDASGATVVSDRSDSAFTIEVVKLGTPNGGKTYTPGDPLTITWTTNATKKSVAKVKLFYTKDGGATWNLITTLTGNPGSYPWTVPPVIKTRTNCKVKVVLRDESGNILGADSSDDYFIIQL